GADTGLADGVVEFAHGAVAIAIKHAGGDFGEVIGGEVEIVVDAGGERQNGHREEDPGEIAGRAGHGEILAGFVGKWAMTQGPLILIEHCKPSSPECTCEGCG